MKSGLFISGIFRNKAKSAQLGGTLGLE